MKPSPLSFLIGLVLLAGSSYAQSSVLSAKLAGIAGEKPTEAVSQVTPAVAPKPQQVVTLAADAQGSEILTEEQEIKRLLALPPINVPIQQSTLSAAVDLISATAGMNYITPAAEEFPETVSLTTKINPYKVLQLLGDRYRFTMQYRDGVWLFTREQTGALVTRTYELHFNNMDTFKASQNSFSSIGGITSLSGSGSSGGGGGGGNESGGGLVFTLQTQKIVDDLKELIGASPSAIYRDGKMPSIDNNFQVARVKGEAGDGSADRKQSVTVVSNGGKVLYLSDANSVIVTTTRRGHEQVAEYLKVADRKPVLVHMEARFIETSHSPSLIIGMDPSKFQPGVSVTPMDKLNGTVDFGRLSSATAPKGVLSFDTMAFQLKALQTDDKSKLVNSPSVDVISNREAYFSVGDEEPFVTSSMTTGSSELGSSQTNVSIRRIGTSVNIIPTVFPGVDGGPAHIRMQVRIEVGVLKGFRQIGAVSIPVVTSQKYEYMVYLKDGETLAFGGLASMNVSEGSRKVPIAGDIPLLGYLFKSKNKSATQNMLVAYITARIRTSDEAVVMPALDMDVNKPLTPSH